ncbi:MAG: flagellar hook-basal body complex protein [Desulfovibrio sp.]|uniref:flagellar hook-basal body complex protein n=1 Tax=Desulfovibrio sp. TaxID=885 RepID=UPI00135ECC7D|nr:flagellar hook-basal body complex protein [Desulfovibrio sp.]MTJ92794.1 flagellar hook-basal body complex protein [Desulfovibrio sp.]
MSLSSSMWASVSGLMAHGNKMNIVGNNIANVSTLAYKGQRADFSDYLYTDGGSVSGTTQIGQGVSTYAVLGDYSQGSFESTNSVTDLAIDGNGFFQVRKPNSEQMYYTRAGDFYFNNNRELQNPEGYLLQGWKVDNTKSLSFYGGSTSTGSTTATNSAYKGTGTPVDIVLDSWNIPPQQTTNVSFTMGLTNDGTGDKTTSSTSPMTALFDLWDARSTPPMADSAYATQSSIKVYDEGGSTHNLTVYYDQVDASKTDTNGKTVYSIEGLPAGYTMYEYMVTIPPAEDQRGYGGQGYNSTTNTWATEPTKFYNDPVMGTNKQAGVLMSGVMIFDASGKLVNQTAYSYGATETPAANNQVAVDPSLKSSWQPTKTSSNGLPVFSANFSGQPLANSVSETMTQGSTTVSQVEKQITELDFGLKDIGNPTWNNPIVTTVQKDSAGNPIGTLPWTGASAPLGMNSFGYYALSNGQYGTANGAALDPVYADSKGYYWKDTTVGANPANVYGTLSTALGNLNVGSNSGVYYVVSGGTTYTNKTTDTTTGNVYPSGSDSYGNFYTVAGTKYYGAFDDGGTLRRVYHNGTNYEYLDGGGTPHTLTSTTSFEVNVAKPITPTTYTLPDAGTRPNPTMVTGNNTLASLTTESKQTSVAPTTGVPIYKNVVNYGTVVPTMTSVQRGDSASVSNTTSYTVQNRTQDGYASGTLSNVKIDNNGVVNGVYSNSKTLPLYQIALYDFKCTQGLYREGSNLYAQTNESGEANLGVAGDNGFGSTKAYNIEQSNVDMSREFVQMIATQRGFQANSKTITTVDSMLETVIGMKR